MVTDKDREAAANVAHLCGWSGTIQHDMRHGVCEGIAHEYPDQVALVQAFAAHREAAIAERDAQLVNWLRERVNTPAPSNDGLTARAAISLIADAIEMKEPWSLNQYYEGE